MNPSPDAYRAAKAAAAFLDRTDRVRLDVSGPDRAKFLHNLTTNDVKRLPVGQGAEAFVTSPQGKTIGHVTLLSCDDRVIVRTATGGAEHVLPHFRKYGVFDEVAIDDLGARTFEFHVAGPGAEAILRRVGAEPPEPGELRHRAVDVAGKPVRLVRESPLGVAGLTLIGDRADATPTRAALREAGVAFGLTDLDAASAEALRIEAGTPEYGRDVRPDNLPQEVARDDRAINFVKGCYLGQETVARIDALGHVNKLLRGLTLSGGIVPAAGAAIEAEGKTVGAVTSAAVSPGRGCPVALGYLRTTHAGAGTPVRVAAGATWVDAVVTDLPMPPA